MKNRFVTVESCIEWLEFRKRTQNIDYEIVECEGIEFILQYRDIKQGFKTPFKFITATHSPLIRNKNIKSDEILKIYKEILQKRLKKITNIKVRHFSLGYEFNDEDLVRDIFSDFKVKRWATFMTKIDNLDKLWKSYRSKIRYEVNKSKRQGLYIKELEESDLIESLKIKNEAKQRDSLKLMSEKTWKVNLMFYIKSKFFLPIGVFKEDKMVATAILSYYGNTMSWGGLAVSNFAKENRLNALHYLNWWAIKKAFLLELRYFDTVGYNPLNRNKREDGIYLFKKRLANLDIKYFLLE